MHSNLVKTLQDLDVHTHRLSDRGGTALVNLPYEHPQDDPLSLIQAYPMARCTVGIHPWWAERFTLADVARLADMAAHPQVWAVGECGLDRLRGGDMVHQQALFEAQITLADQVNKPLIIHCVRCFSELLSLHKKRRPRSLWIVHGFRGKAALATQLTRVGIGLSFGPLFQVAALRACPTSLRFTETDDSPLSLLQVRDLQAAALHQSI